MKVHFILMVMVIGVMASSTPQTAFRSKRRIYNPGKTGEYAGQHIDSAF